MSLEFPTGPNIPPLTKEQMDELGPLIAAKYAEARNHGKTLYGNFKATKHELGFSGLEGGGLYREIEAAVCVAFGVRPEILAMMIGLENAPWSHMQTAQRLSYDETIIPLWRRIERAITRQLLRQVDDDASHLVRFDTSKIRALQADAEADARRSLLVRDIATRNQRRQIAGLEPMEEDLEYWDAVQEKAPAAPAAAPEAAPVKRGAGPLLRKDASDDLAWTLFDEVTRAQEFAWEMSAAAQLEADRAACVALATETLRATRKDDDPFAPADASTVRELIEKIAEHMDMAAAVQWRARVGPLTAATARRAVERVIAELGLSFDLLQPGLLEYTEREAAWLVTQVTDTTKQEIRAALTAGLAEGESVPQLTARIQEATTFARPRAELIARTETTRVTNGGQRDTLAAYAAESGDKITKRWLTARDDRVRDAHRELEGEMRGVDEAFSNGLQAPGEPNCRCTLTYAMEAA
jgi:SPP1 gp7 family putative phage head morphogenesis protein